MEHSVMEIAYITICNDPVISLIYGPHVLRCCMKTGVMCAVCWVVLNSHQVTVTCGSDCRDGMDHLSNTCNSTLFTWIHCSRTTPVDIIQKDILLSQERDYTVYQLLWMRMMVWFVIIITYWFSKTSTIPLPTHAQSDQSPTDFGHLLL